MGSIRQFTFASVLCCTVVQAGEAEPAPKMLLRLVAGDEEYRAELEAVNSTAHTLCRCMQQAVEALSRVQDTATAAAATPAVLEMKQAEAALKTAIGEAEKRGIPPDGLYKARRFGAHVRRMPIQAYNEQLSRLLLAECFDCPALYLALTGQHSKFDSAAMEAPLSETDTATLQALEAFFQQAVSPKNAFTKTELLQQVDALQARVDALAASPRAAMKRTRLEQQYAPHIYWKGPTTGEFEQRCFLKPDNFLAALYTSEYRKRYFSMRHAQKNKTPDSARLQQEALARHHETLAAARSKYCYPEGDGLTPQTAMRLKNARKDTCTEILNAFSREAFGADAVFSDPKCGQVTDLRGRTIIRALALAGRSTHKSASLDTPLILLEIYFYLPRY